MFSFAISQGQLIELILGVSAFKLFMNVIAAAFGIEKFGYLSSCAHLILQATDDSNSDAHFNL